MLYKWNLASVLAFHSHFVCEAARVLQGPVDTFIAVLGTLSTVDIRAVSFVGWGASCAVQEVKQQPLHTSASRTPPVMTTKNVSQHSECPPEGRMLPLSGDPCCTGFHNINWTTYHCDRTLGLFLDFGFYR